MNLSKDKILSVLRNIPAQIRFILEGKSSKYIFPGKQVFISPYGLGDTFILCLFASSWEKKHGRKIHFLIKPSHEAILKGFGRTDYTLVSLSEFPLHYLGTRNPWNNIRLNEIFVAHMRMHRSCRKHTAELFNGKIDLMELYRRFLGLDPDYSEMAVFRENMNSVKLSSDIDLKRTVLFVPTANTLRHNDNLFWNKLKSSIEDRGFKIFENDGKTPLDQVFALGMRCHRTVTFRSGLSDIFSCRNEGTITLYPNDLSFKQYSLETMFKKNTGTELVLDSHQSAIIQKVLEYL